MCAGQVEGRDSHGESEPIPLLLSKNRDGNWNLWGKQAICGVSQAHRCLYPQMPSARLGLGIFHLGKVH